MENASELLISNRDGVYLIRVCGRATFECAPPLRNLAKSLEQTSFSEINVDLSACSWMDSTFMGILAMLGLRARKIDAVMNICNAGEQNRNLLYGLGLKKLFCFVDGPVCDADAGNTWNDGTENSQPNAQTVLDAHKTLMDVDEQNVKKFERVVDMVQKDIDRLNQEKN